MIYVTVGTDVHDFSRLVKEMDKIALRRKVVMQIGNTVYEPRNAEWFRFETNQRIDELYQKADVIVTHAGAGSIIRSLKNGKVPIVVPRLKKYGEHVNDHQLDLARFLGKRGKVIPIARIEDLKGRIKKRYLPLKKDSSLAVRLAAYLEGIE